MPHKSCTGRHRPEAPASGRTGPPVGEELLSSDATLGYMGNCTYRTFTTPWTGPGRNASWDGSNFFAGAEKRPEIFRFEDLIAARACFLTIGRAESISRFNRPARGNAIGNTAFFGHFAVLGFHKPLATPLGLLTRRSPKAGI